MDGCRRMVGQEYYAAVPDFAPNTPAQASAIDKDMSSRARRALTTRPCLTEETLTSTSVISLASLKVLQAINQTGSACRTPRPGFQALPWRSLCCRKFVRLWHKPDICICAISPGYLTRSWRVHRISGLCLRRAFCRTCRACLPLSLHDFYRSFWFRSVRSDVKCHLTAHCNPAAAFTLGAWLRVTLGSLGRHDSRALAHPAKSNLGRSGDCLLHDAAD